MGIVAAGVRSLAVVGIVAVEAGSLVGVGSHRGQRARESVAVAVVAEGEKKCCCRVAEVESGQ